MLKCSFYQVKIILLFAYFLLKFFQAGRKFYGFAPSTTKDEQQII
jgi:hypothetical protein